MATLLDCLSDMVTAMLLVSFGFGWTVGMARAGSLLEFAKSNMDIVRMREGGRVGGREREETRDGALLSTAWALFAISAEERDRENERERAGGGEPPCALRALL